MKFRLNFVVQLSCWLGLLLLASCSAVRSASKPSSAQGNVEAQELTIPTSERYEQSANVEYIRSLAYPENKMPVYPAELLARRLPRVVVTVRLIIDTSGIVARVESLDATGTPERDRLFDTVRDTCLLWKFSPLIRLDLDAGPTTVVESDGTTTYKGRPTALPFHLDYAFNFSQLDGRPHVESVGEKPSK